MNHLDSDYFSTCSATGDQFAGRHILADFWGVERMGDLDFIKETVVLVKQLVKVKLMEGLVGI